MKKSDFIFTENVSQCEIDMTLTFFTKAEKMNAIPHGELDIQLINNYMKKIVELDGEINFMTQYIEAFQYFYVLGYEDNVYFNKTELLKAKEICEYERIHSVTGKGKYILDIYYGARK